jgi:hypothetical protein
VPDLARLRRRPSALNPRLRLRIAIVVLGAVAVAIAAGTRFGPLARLANYRADGPGPIYDNPGVDDRILRRAASLLPHDATYGVYGNPLYDLQGGALLYFPPALQIAPENAQWVLSYRAGRLLPPGLRSLRSYRLADGVYLVRVRRA